MAKIDTAKIEKAIEREVRVQAKRLAHELIHTTVREFEVQLEEKVLSEVETILDNSFEDR